MSDDSREDREQQRLDALRRYDVVDTPREEALDEVARLAADSVGAPIGLISFVGTDTLFFKAASGIDVQEMPRDMSFCEAAIGGDGTLTIPDASKDERFADTPLVAGPSHIRFYAGAQLKTREGLAIGTLCVLDTVPREPGDAQLRALEVLARQVMHQLELRLELRKRDEAEVRYQTLFDSMDGGFCIIEFFDGPHGPLSDYVHVEANAAYARHAGIPDVVGQKLREMVGDEADEWVARYGGVLRTGEPIRFEQELVATGRYLSLSAFRIEPPERNQVAVLFQDITARRRAEQELRQLNETLEARVAAP